VCDNFSPHQKSQVNDWCADHDVELVFTPSNASWLNWIESEFTALRYFTLDGSGDLRAGDEDLRLVSARWPVWKGRWRRSQRAPRASR
jgi:DDE superfamily endonuclease